MERRLRPASLYPHARASVLIPPTHSTLYTRPGGKGIDVHDEEDLRSLTEPLGGRRAQEIRRAIGLVRPG